MSVEPANEAVQSYSPGSPERAELRAEIARQMQNPRLVPAWLAGERRITAQRVPLHAPHRHDLLLGEACVSGGPEVEQAVERALTAQQSWSALDQTERSAIFSKAAELLSGPFRQRLNAATLLGQSKTPHQAEIDAACELCDFLRFNSHFAAELTPATLRSPPGEQNTWDLRPLEGFVYAVTPFNFTSIAGNLPTAPALLGNVVLWKPSPLALPSAQVILELLESAGLPEGVIQMVSGDAASITRAVLAQASLAGIHFTGSSAVFEQLSQRVSEGLRQYRNYPRLVAETGGKDFIVAHPSADLDALCVAIVRGGFEYQGQKCSAPSRAYVPRSLWRGLEPRLIAAIEALRVGDPADFSCFMGAVISRPAHERLTSAIERAKLDVACRVVCGGRTNDEVGYFVQPTLIEVNDADHALLRDELFGPVVSVLVYDDDRFDQVLETCDRTSPYGLTGAIFARDRTAVEQASLRLRYAAGNFYINDKPTGAVVGQQPFGGARHSGSNDKSGSALNLLRWVSPRVIKENLHPPRSIVYPYQAEPAAQEPSLTTVAANEMFT